MRRDATRRDGGEKIVRDKKAQLQHDEVVGVSRPNLDALRLMLNPALDLRDDGGRRSRNVRRRPIVLLQEDGATAFEILFEPHDVRVVRAPEVIDALVGVTDDEYRRRRVLRRRYAGGISRAALGFAAFNGRGPPRFFPGILSFAPGVREGQNQVVLRTVGVLPLVDENMSIPPSYRVERSCREREETEKKIYTQIHKHNGLKDRVERICREREVKKK